MTTGKETCRYRTVAELKVAYRKLRHTHTYSVESVLPKRFTNRIRTAGENLRNLIDDIEAWPVSADERAQASLRGLRELVARTPPQPPAA